jgi:hypothetical protein
MIVSHKYKFIFIKTHKTAGSSMEMALAPLCGQDDVVTPMESNILTDIPRNYYEKNLIGSMYSKSRLFRKCIHRHSGVLGKWYYEHMPALRVKELVGEEIWNTYYKFCFERNPWEKVVSYYNWKKHGQGRSIPPFEEYVLQKTHRLPLDARLYFDDDVSIMDDVFDYNNFMESFTEVCNRLNIPFDGKMPSEKTGINKNSTEYQECYTDETRECIEHVFNREIKLMHYQFESTTI